MDASGAENRRRIVILGGGFAGVYTAMYLEKMMRRAERARIEIKLVNQENYIVFQPLLPEVISGTIEMLHVISPIRRLAKRTQLHTRELDAIDLENRTVRLAPEFRPKPTELQYDHLVVSLGTRLNHAIVPGMREHAIPFKYLGDALRLRNEIVGKLEEADNEPDPAEKRKLLTFVVAGGGFSGVECIAELNDFLHRAVPAYAHVDANEPRLVLLQSAERILPELGEDLAQYAHRILERRGIEIRLNTRMKAVTADGALIQNKQSDGQEILPARTVVATVPSAPHALISNLPCELDRGRVKVDEFLAVPGWPGVWAVGDCAAVPQPDGITSPPTAQHALRQAKACARNILASIRGESMQPFTFTGLGKLASLGRRSAVAEIMGVKMSGLMAWILWRAVYLSKFPGLDRKIRIGADWVMDLFLPRDITQLRIFQSPAVAREHFHTGDWVFDEGDFGDKIYVIVEGQVEIVKDDEPIATLTAGDVFGEIALISDSPRTAGAQATTPVDVIAVSREAFKTLVTHLPGVKTTMAELMLQHGVEAIDLKAEVADPCENS